MDPAPDPALKRRNISGHYRQAQGDHPETDYRQEADKAQQYQQQSYQPPQHWRQIALGFFKKQVDDNYPASMVSLLGRVGHC